MRKEYAVLSVLILVIIALTHAGGGRDPPLDPISMEINAELAEQKIFMMYLSGSIVIGICVTVISLAVLYNNWNSIEDLWYRCMGWEPRERLVRAPSHVRAPSTDPPLDQECNTDDESGPRIGGAARYIRPRVEGDGMLAEVGNVSFISPSVLRRTRSRRNEAREGADLTPRAATHQIAADVHRPRHVAQLSDDESSPERGPEDEPKRPMRVYHSRTDVQTIPPRRGRSRAASLRGSQSTDAVAELSDNES